MLSTHNSYRTESSEEWLQCRAHLLLVVFESIDLVGDRGRAVSAKLRWLDWLQKIDITTSIDQDLISKPGITIFDTITLTFQILPGVGGLWVAPCSSVSSTGDDSIVVFWSWIWQKCCWRWSCLPECGRTETSLKLEEELHSGQRHGLPSSERSCEWGVDIEEEDLKINLNLIVIWPLRASESPSVTTGRHLRTGNIRKF